MTYSQFGPVEALRVGRFPNRINTTCHLYRIGTTLIDTGPRNQWRKVWRFLKERPIERVLLTHHHEDHGGNAGLIEKKCQAPVFAEERGLAPLTRGFPLPFYRRVVWGKPKRLKQARILPERVEMEDGFSLLTLHSPGHAADMVSFLEPERGWLFCGDLYISSNPKYLRADEDPNLEIESLKKVLAQSFDTVFCAHRGRLENGRESLKTKLKYLVTLREQVQHYKRVGDSLKEIRKRLMGEEEFLHWISLGEFSKQNYIRAFATQIREDDRPTHEELW